MEENKLTISGHAKHSPGKGYFVQVIQNMRVQNY